MNYEEYQYAKWLQKVNDVTYWIVTTFGLFAGIIIGGMQ